MYIPEIWLGTQRSYWDHIQGVIHYEENRAKYAEMETSLSKAKMTEDDDDDEWLSNYLCNNLVSTQGNVGIISISGSLVSEEGYSNIWRREVAYPTIAAAFNKLLADPSITQIVAAWASSGGDASGIEDLGAFIKDAGKLKPVTSWTGRSALSAAYWAASAAKKVRASPLGETGSIGVIATFQSYKRMLEEDGIDVHVERSGKFKALLHPAEAITKEGINMMKEKCAVLHGFFIENIEQQRPKLKSVERDVWAEGKTYFAEEAIRIGLVDGPPISLSRLISDLNSANTQQSNRGNSTMTKQVMMQAQEQALLAAGVSAEEIARVKVEQEAFGAGAAAENAPAPAAEVTSPTTPAATTPATTAAAESAPEGSDPLSAYLKEQLSAAQLKVSELTTELAGERARATQLANVEAALVPIAIEAIHRLQVAVNQAPAVLTGLPAATLAEQYAQVKGTFDTWLTSGRKSQGAQDTSVGARSLEDVRLQIVPGRAK